MSEKSNGWLGAVIPRTKPVTESAEPEGWNDSAQKRGGLLKLHPVAKMADDYVSQIVNKLTDVVSAVEARKESAEHAYETASGVADGAGNVTLYIEPHMDFDYEIERIATRCTGAGAGVGIYLNNVDDASLIATIPNTANPQTYADSIPNNLFVPIRNRVAIVFTGLTAGSNAFVRCQVTRHIYKQGGEVSRA